ncbi:MAG TPA: PAS domain-containing protein [Telluria sp.]|jgi:CheY-like chemotaxis protein
MPENLPAAGEERDLVLEDDDPDDLFAATAQDSIPWRILIVDDDVDVHVVTKFALSNTNFQGRRLSFLHAYTGQEALAILRETPDIALVLLDVIMETPDAGLALARQIRGELGNDMVRIVLRTGQPGQALEHSIIVDYDINDFWCKTDLTTRKLFTTVIASLRAYASLAAASAQRQALRTALSHAQQLNAVIEQHALVLTLDGAGRILDANEPLCKLAGLPRASLLGRDLHALHAGPFPEPLRSELVKALAQDSGWAGDVATTTPGGAPLVLRCAALAFRDIGGAPYQYVAVATRLEPH